MPQLDNDTVVRRVEADRLARSSSAIEGLDARPDDAEVLNPFARGEFDRAEFMRRVSVEFRGGRAHK